MIKIIEGNLFDTDADIIAHQVNCQGQMNSGVARQVKERYPEAFRAYALQCCFVVGEESCLLGTMQPIVCTNKATTVVNLYGQDKFGYDGELYTNVSALTLALKRLHRYAELTDFTVAMPWKIGCCRGGADWDKDVYPIIQELWRDSGSLELWKLPEGVNDNEI